jgi:oligoribonuclease
MAENDRLVWIDLEMTGLDLDRHVIVEIACVVTDGDLQPLDAGVSYVVRASDAELAEMDDFVTEMHTKSGLLPEIPNGIELEVAESQVMEYVKSHISEPRKAPLAGSSIYVDRGFLSRAMPALDSYLHYRLVDVSSIKELCRRWYPRTYFASPDKQGNHRALGDIADSIRELKYYRELIFVKGSGPSMADAKLVTDQLSGHPHETDTA